MSKGRLFRLGILFFPFWAVFSPNLFAQSVVSVSDGPWNDPATWSLPIIPDASNTTSITVDHAVTIPNGFLVTIDQTVVNGSLAVAGKLTIANSPNELIINGLLSAQNTSSILATDGTNVAFSAGSTYRHDFTTLQGSVPLAQWDPASTLIVAGYTSGKTLTAVGNWSQNFGDFTLQCHSLAGQVNFSGLLTSVRNLSIADTGGGQLFLGSVQTYTLAIGGSLNVSGTARLIFATTGSPTFNITSDLSFTSTSAGGSATSTTGQPVFNIGRDFSMNAPSGLLRIGNVGGTGGATFNVTRNFDVAAGTLSESSNDPGAGTINFNSSGSHLFSNSGSIQNRMNYNIGANDMLTVVGESGLVGGGNSTLDLAGTLVLNSAHANGALQIGYGASQAGNIWVQNRTYDPGATIVYGGSSAQVIGSGQPGDAGVITQVNNSAGVSVNNTLATFVTFSSLQIISGTLTATNFGITATDLTLQGGSLAFVCGSTSHALTINGNLQLTSGTITVTSAPTTADLIINGDILAGTGGFSFVGGNDRITVGGTGAFTSEFPLVGASSIRAITISRGGGGTLGFSQDLTVNDITLNTGNMDLNGAKKLIVTNSLNMATGTRLFFEGSTVQLSRFFNNTLSGGLLSSDGLSTLSVLGASALGTIAFSPTGNTLGTLQLNRTGGGTLMTLNSPLTISTNFLLTDGLFANTSGLNMASGATITMTPNASFTGASATPTGGPYNLIYNDATGPVTISVSTTAETKGSLHDVSLNLSGTLTVGTAMSVQGTLFLNSGIFSNPTAKLNMVSGATISRSSTGTFAGSIPTGGPYNLIYTGTTLSSGNESRGSLNNFTSNVSGTVTTTFLMTVPGTAAINSGTLNILSNTLTMGNLATFVRQSGTTISGAAPSGGPYNLVYNGSNLTTQVEMQGTLNNVSTNLTGTVTQANALTAAGTLFVNTGVWDAGANNVTIAVLLNAATFEAPSTFLTLTGNLTDNGIFHHHNGTVVFNGVSSLTGTSSTPFNNIQLNAAKTLTLPAIVDVAGNIVFASGSIFNHSSGNVILNGAGLQSIDPQGAQFYAITVSKGGGSVDLLSALPLANVLSINSAVAFNSNGFLTVLSQPNGPGDDTGNDGSIGAITPGGSVTGAVIVQRFIRDKGLGNRYISAAVSNVGIADITDDFSVIPGSIRFYNESIRGTIDKGYTNISSLTLPLEVGRGYLAYMQDGVDVQWDVTGSINSGSVGLPVSYTSTPNLNADGWNLVGNPFPSPIVWNNTPGAWSRANVDPVITVYDISGTASYTYNYTNGSGSLPNGMIATGQSFWVHLSASGSLSVNETAKFSAAGGKFFRTRDNKPEQLIVGLSGKGFRDNALIVIDPQATAQFDPLYDGIKFVDERMSIYFRDPDGRNLVMNAFNELPNEVNIPVEIASAERGEFAIDFSGNDGFAKTRPLYLIDRDKVKSVAVTTGTKYAFTIDKPGTISGRFYLSSRAEVEERPVSDALTFFPNPVINDLAIFTGVKDPVRIEIYNALGELVQSATVTESGTMNTKEWSKGMYIIKGRYQKGVAAKRVIKQ